ncbi:MAG TPA: hypothetical protein VL371_02895, partial [Gemmataceae bacterium]|nr:hypothetical protein [Gemmataceae bacterium]
MRLIVVLTLAALLLMVPSAHAADDCDRACLKSTLGQYLSAVAKHDPSAAPLFAGFRQTENAVVKRPGTGLWQTMTGLGRLQRYYMDPVTGQAAYFGLVNEGTIEAIVTVRVRVERRKITEAEWYIGRRGDDSMNGPVQPNGQGGNLFNPDNLVANAPGEGPVPREARVSRDEMIAATNSYFDGISSHDGKIIMATPGCPRFENGQTMAGRGNTPPPPAPGTPPPVGPQGRGAAGGPPLAADCTAGLETINIQFVAARRYPLIDEEAGVVMATAVFIRPPGRPQRRNAFAEWFYFDRGKIKSIYSAMFYPPDDVPL